MQLAIFLAMFVKMKKNMALTSFNIKCKYKVIYISVVKLIKSLWILMWKADSHHYFMVTTSMYMYFL